MELDLYLPQRQLLTSRTVIDKLQLLVTDQTDRAIPLQLYLLGAGATPGAVVSLALPAPFTKIILAARSADNLAEADLLFSVTDFATNTIGSGPTLVTWYTSALTTHTTALAAKFPDSNPSKRTQDALVDILFTNDDGSLEEVYLRQQPCTIYRQIYQGTEGVPVSGDPAYPLPGAIALRTVAGKYRIKDDGTFELWNPTQGKFHPLTLSGAAGAEILTIGAGE